MLRVFKEEFQTMSKPDRSPWGSHPPYILFSEALDLTRQIYEHGGGRASRDLVSKITGNSASSSSFARKVSALKAFDLVTTPSKDEIELTDLAYRIVAPRDAASGEQGKKEAFLKPEIFSRVFDRHKGKLLPADEYLRNILEQDLGVPRGLSSTWVKAFREGLQTANLLHARGDGKFQILESPVPKPSPTSISVEATDSFSAADRASALVSKADVHGEPIATTSVPFAASGHCTKIEVSSGQAVFQIPDKINTRDAKKLKKALLGLSQIIDSMIDDDENSEDSAPGK
jgi:hypothetical protein